MLLSACAGNVRVWRRLMGLISRPIRRVLEALERGEAPTWLRESREALAREVLHAETAGVLPVDLARAFIVNLGPGEHQRFAHELLEWFEGETDVEPPVPPGVTRHQAARVRTL